MGRGLLEMSKLCWGSRVFPPAPGGGGVDRAPQNGRGGAWEKGSIERTNNQLL